MGKTNYYKQAPTWLFNLEGETKLFQTQEEVDAAWKDGWFGPQGLAIDSPLLSTLDFETKQGLIDAVEEDPRYSGLILKLRMTMEELEEAVADFEEEEEVIIE